MKTSRVLRNPAISMPNNLPKVEIPELPLEHKTLIQWEANVDKNKFEYGYIYHYEEDNSRAEIALKIEAVVPFKVIIYFTFGRAFPYELVVNDQQVFVSDTLRDVTKWLDNNLQ